MKMVFRAFVRWSRRRRRRTTACINPMAGGVRLDIVLLNTVVQGAGVPTWTRRKRGQLLMLSIARADNVSWLERERDGVVLE